MTAALRKQKRLSLVRYAFIFAWLLAVPFFVSHAANAEELPRGVVIEKVVCQRDAEQSYALFLPSGYTPEKKWPVIYAFDPFARGPAPVARFKEGAEKYGYILVGSNNSRNGPPNPSIIAFKAMSRDLHERFAIDDRRVYVTGLSGGARFASFAATNCENCVAGLIACAAGFNPGFPPSKKTSFVIFATVGIDDFNYPELMALDVTLEKLGVPHRVAIFEGGHQWPPSEVCMEAIEWMEIEAIKSGRRQKDDALVRALFDKGLKRAQTLEEQKKVYEALLVYQSLAVSFKELLETGALERKVSELKASKEIKERVKQEKAQIEEQRLISAELVNLINQLNDRDERTIAQADLHKRVAELRKRADAAEDSFDRRVARRTLRQVYAQFYEAATLGDTKDRQGAIAQLQIAAEIAPRDPSAFYEMAILYAQGGDKKRALEALKRSVENGLKNLSLIEGNKDLSRLRDEPEYQKIIESLKTK